MAAAAIVLFIAFGSLWMVSPPASAATRVRWSHNLSGMGFSFPVRVPYFQVDQQGVVFNMWYLAWFDEAMSDFFEAVGLPYDVLTASGADVQLVHSEIDWRNAVRYGDDIEIEVAVGSIGTTSFSLTFAVMKDTETVASARTVYVVVGVDGSGKRPIPAELRAALGGSGAEGDGPQATGVTESLPHPPPDQHPRGCGAGATGTA